jgi:hypothetical protein
MNDIEKRQGAEDLFPCFTPSLAAILLNREKALGRPLTEHEVNEIRDQSSCVMLPISMKPKMDESRGYVDIDPENCWNEWQQLRSEFE